MNYIWKHTHEKKAFWILCATKKVWSSLNWLGDVFRAKRLLLLLLSVRLRRRRWLKLLSLCCCYCCCCIYFISDNAFGFCHFVTFRLALFHLAADRLYIYPSNESESYRYTVNGTGCTLFFFPRITTSNPNCIAGLNMCCFFLFRSIFFHTQVSVFICTLNDSFMARACAMPVAFLHSPVLDSLYGRQ